MKMEEDLKREQV